MALEMVKDALFEALEEMNGNTLSWKIASKEKLENYAKSLENRADYYLEMSEVLKNETYKQNAIRDLERAVKTYEFLEEFSGMSQRNNISNIQTKLSSLGGGKAYE